MGYEAGRTEDDQIIVESAFEFEPVSVQKVAFHPLTTIFACSADRNSDNATSTSRDRNWYSDFNEYIKGALGEGTGLVDEHMYGKMFSRLKDDGPRAYYQPAAPDCEAIYGSGTLTGGFDQVVYDVYCNRQSSNQPINTVVNPFYDSNACANGLGSNLAGVITARNTFTKPGGGAVNFELEQSFGYNGERINSASTNVYNSFLSGGTLAGAFLGSIVGPGAVNQLTSAWGSQDNDDIDSMGTTALHNRIFDYWPRNQTLFFEPYFAVCHVNPGEYGSMPVTETRISKVNEDTGEIDFNNDSSDLDESSIEAGLSNGTLAQYEYDLISFDCDFKVPTYYDNSPVPIGSVINADTLMRPMEYSRVATFLRGNVISNGGLRYYKNTVGLSNNFIVDDGGAGFRAGQRINGPNGSVLIVAEVTTSGEGEDAVGGVISRVGIATQVATEENNFVDGELRGQGFEAKDFRVPNEDDGDLGGLVFTVTSETATSNAKIRCLNGTVYTKLLYQISPKERIPKTRLSTGSGDGKQKVTGGLTVTEELPRNDDHVYPNKYEVFFYFHNDITHNQFFEVGTTAGREMPYQQYITMTMK